MSSADAITWRAATEADLPLLAEWNHQLIRDEGHRNPMGPAQLEERMRGWLKEEYKAVIFSRHGPVGYALYRQGPSEIYLRQFFVDRTQRRTGVGTGAFSLLRGELWPSGVRLTVDVLSHNAPALAFWRSVGYRDYLVTLEIAP